MALIQEQANVLKLACRRFGRSFTPPRTQLHASMCQINDGIAREFTFIAQVAWFL
jgi:hypothetical protein